MTAYTYDETNRLVSGKNEQGEYSLYTYNGLGMRVGRELIMKDNTHGYTDFHDLTPSITTDIDKPEVVKESYVIDYTSSTFNPLTMDEDGGFSYRYVYGLNTLSVKITSEGTNWWGQHVTTDILKDYYHQDRLGSTTNLTDKFGRVVGRADYNEWGELTYREALTITSSYRRIYPQSNYTGHDWDDVLGMYYAKARFYSAEDKRFVAMDPVKGWIIEPLTLVPYLYCIDNPLRWVDPTGEIAGIDDAVVMVYLGGTVLALTYAEWVAWVNSPEGQEAITNITKVVVDGIAYIGDDIQLFANSVIDAGKWVGGKIVDGITWIGEQASAAWDSVTSYFKTIICETEIVTGIGNIAGRYGNYECVDAANAMEEYLKENNQHGSIILIQYPSSPGYVMSLMYNKVISTNGHHRGICYNGIVYCNVHPLGLPKQLWLNDFDAVGIRTVTEIPF